MDRDGRAPRRVDGPLLSDDPRYQRLLEATREAAARGGYDAVQMRDIAAAARVSLATVYQYCASKDRLITEAHVDWVHQFRAELASRPPAGPTARARVAAVLRQMCRSLDRHRNLTATILRAMYAPEPGVHQSRCAITRVYGAIVDDAIGDAPVPDRPAVIEVLGFVIEGVLARWVTEGLSSTEAARILERAARVLLPD